MMFMKRPTKIVKCMPLDWDFMALDGAEIEPYNDNRFESNTDCWL